MLLNIPFYRNNGDGNQCMQVGMQSVLKYFLGKDFSLEELDELTGRKPNLWTWTVQIVSVLFDLGLDVKYYSKINFEEFLEGEPYIRKQYGKDADMILKYSDIHTLIKYVKKLKNYNIFAEKKLLLDEIEANIKQGHILLVVIDNNKIKHRNELYQGHLVVLTGFDENYIYYHDSGPDKPEKNKKVPKKIFEKAMNSNGTDNDVVIIYGKR